MYTHLYKLNNLMNNLCLFICFLFCFVLNEYAFEKRKLTNVTLPLLLFILFVSSWAKNCFKKKNYFLMIFVYV